MYYEEKMIDGVLCWRGGQNDEWQPISTEGLSRRLLAADSRVADLEGLLRRAADAMNMGWPHLQFMRQEIATALRGEGVQGG